MTRFLSETGNWLGEGEIELSESPEKLKFFCRWKIEVGEVTRAVQEVQIEGVEEVMTNHYIFSGEGVELTNEGFSGVQGKVLREEGVIGWEFHGLLEGFEIYRQHGDTHTHMRAEYTSGEGLRTKIEGTIWVRASTD